MKSSRNYDAAILGPTVKLIFIPGGILRSWCRYVPCSFWEEKDALAGKDVHTVYSPVENLQSFPWFRCWGALGGSLHWHSLWDLLSSVFLFAKLMLLYIYSLPITRGTVLQTLCSMVGFRGMNRFSVCWVGSETEEGNCRLEWNFSM